MKRYKKHFTKVRGEIFDELSRRISTRKDLQEMQRPGVVIKNKKFIDNSRQMYQRKF